MLTENDLRPVEWEHKAPTRNESWVAFWKQDGVDYYASVSQDSAGLRLYAVVESDIPPFKQELHARFATLTQAQTVAERWLAGAAALAQGACGEV